MSSSTTLAQCAARWFNQKVFCTLSTRTRYEAVIRLHINPIGGDLRINECTPYRLETLVAAISAAAGPHSASQARKILSQVLGYATRLGALQHNPALETARVDTPVASPRPIGFDVVHMIRDGARRWQAGLSARTDGSGPNATPSRGRPPSRDIADLVDLILATGVRIGEALALRWRDIDLDTGGVIIAATLVWEKPDNGPRYLVRRADRKSGGAPLALHLPAFALDSLRARRERPGIHNENDLDAVFPSAVGSWRDQGNVRKQWYGLLQELGLPRHHLHDLRATTATAVEKAAGIATAAAQLGHASEAMTRKHYVPIRPTGPDVADALDAAFGDGQ